MLSPQERDTIGLKAYVYDHEWRAYAAIFGEPFLIRERHLVYFDGVILYVNAFGLQERGEELDASGLDAIVAACPAFSSAKAVAIWGSFDLGGAVNVGGRRLERVEFSEYDPTFVDTTIDLGSGPETRRARAAGARAKRSGLTLAVPTRPACAYEHLALMQHWSETHEVSPYHAAFASSWPTYARSPDITVLEARSDGGALAGVAVVSLGARSRATLLHLFNQRSAGQKVGDFLYAAAIDLCRGQHREFLHVGYSATAGIKRFKEKWGGIESGPPFRDAFFSDDKRLIRGKAAGLFVWQHRLALGHDARP